MAGESTYPAVIDTDDILYRVDTDDTLVPAMLNNKTDAIETLELVVGAVDDGTGNGGASALTTGLAHYVGMPSTAGPNPRYPWSPAATNAWYAAQGAPPAGWTVAGGLSIDYTKPNGLARVTIPNSANTTLLSVPLPGSAPFEVIIRLIGNRVVAASQSSYALGFSVAGDGSDLYGVYGRYIYPGGISFYGCANAVADNTKFGAAAYGSLITVRLRADGTDLKAWYDGHGGPWGACFDSYAYAVTPTAFCIRTLTTFALAQYLWIDYVALGNAAPDGE